MSAALIGGIRATCAVGWKELVELSRQPKVLVLVVLGPFAVLAAFGLGYRNEELALRTVFVGPSDGPYEDVIDEYTEEIDEYVVAVGYSTDLVAATEDLRNDRVDLVIVLPPEPLEAIRTNNRSEIAVLHDSIDPISQIGIDFATEVAVRELNANVVTASIDGLARSIRAFDSDAAEIDPIAADLIEALESGDDTTATLKALQLRSRVEQLAPSLEVVSSVGVLGNESGSDENDPGAVDVLLRRLDELADSPASSTVELDEIEASLQSIQQELDLLTTVEATTLARPFEGDAESLVREPVTAESHVAPGATALLIQHLAVSLAALSFVRDQRRGILSDLRMGPTSPVSIIIGKLLALSAVSVAAGAAIVVGQVTLLAVPQRGSWAELLGIVAGLAVSGVALGLVLAALSSSELQASQAAMIALLVALFFSGFLLDLDRIIEPFRSLGMLVPATPAVQAMREVQLRGVAPSTTALAVLAAQITVGVAAASALITRRWRSA